MSEGVLNAGVTDRGAAVGADAPSILMKDNHEESGVHEAGGRSEGDVCASLAARNP